MIDRQDESWTPHLAGMVGCVIGLMSKAALLAAPLFLRIALALPFFSSGLTKWNGFLSLSPGVRFLFQEEFKLHLFGQAYDLPAPDLLAFASGTAEIVLPILLILGLATRFSALGLLGMTAVIQLIVPDGWANFHLPWATMAIALIAMGPGALSLDRLISRRSLRSRGALDRRGVTPVRSA